MRILKALLLSLPLSMIALTQTHDASACGGCLLPISETTQVTGHKMALSISKTQTTLWDQITYDGDPKSFAWILPIKGTVDFGLSSDALFQVLEQNTAVTVVAPPQSCAPPPSCGFGSATAGASSGSYGGVPGGVDVLAQAVVGPYEMVQLQSSTPNALTDWLAMHNFNIPPEIGPVIDAYIKEQFNFLALKLVPDQPVTSIQPVRVTTQGAAPVLPLRMVAAGTGAITPITLWVLSEGRYETSNRPTFTINEKDLVWDWNSQSSNYAALSKAGFANSNGNAWQIEAAEPISPYQITNTLNSMVEINPVGSGYADSMGQGAKQALDADLQAFVGGIKENAFWISRLHGELSREALKTDLELGASATQEPLNRYLQTTKSTGAAPVCPVYSPCETAWGFWGTPTSNGTSSSACAMSEKDSSPALLSGLALAAALSFVRARRRRH